MHVVDSYADTEPCYLVPLRVSEATESAALISAPEQPRLTRNPGLSSSTDLSLGTWRQTGETHPALVLRAGYDSDTRPRMCLTAATRRGGAAGWPAAALRPYSVAGQRSRVLRACSGSDRRRML